MTDYFDFFNQRIGKMMQRQAETFAAQEAECVPIQGGATEASNLLVDKNLTVLALLIPLLLPKANVNVMKVIVLIFPLLPHLHLHLHLQEEIQILRPLLSLYLVRTFPPPLLILPRQMVRFTTLKPLLMFKVV